MGDPDNGLDNLQREDGNIGEGGGPRYSITLEMETAIFDRRAASSIAPRDQVPSLLHLIFHFRQYACCAMLECNRFLEIPAPPLSLRLAFPTCTCLL